MQRVALALLVVAGLAFAADLAGTLFGGSGPTTWRDAGCYDTVLASGSISTFIYLLGQHGVERRGRLLITSGMVLWSLGDITWEIWAHNAGNVPTPSPADALYLSMYPCVVVGLLKVVRARVGSTTRSTRLDAAVVGLGVAAVYSYMITPVVRAASGGILAVATETAYPVGDLLLACFLIGLLGALNWRADRFITLFIVGAVLFCVADSHYLLTNAANTYQEGTVFDLGWIGGMLVWCIALRQPDQPGSRTRTSVILQTVAPTAVLLAMMGLLVAATLTHVPRHVVVIALLALGLVRLRTMWTMRELEDAR